MSDPQAITLALLGTILVASLLGSLHCAGMCGGLVLFVVGADGTCTKKTRLQLAYHGGRGVAYTALGAAAGLLGGVVQGAGDLAGVQHAAAVLAGSLMVVFGIATLLRASGSRVPKLRLPTGARRCVEGAHRFALALTPTRRALAVGLLTPLLPCGWLYAFVTAAAGTASPWAGGLVMAGFWLGTLPVLAALGVGLQMLTGPIRSRVPVVSSLIIVGFGVMTALGRVNIPVFLSQEQSGRVPVSLADRVHHAATLDHEDLPCCGPTPAEAPIEVPTDAETEEPGP